jgi:hypothetical protein
MLFDFSVVANTIAKTAKRGKKGLLADYLCGLDDAALERATP